MKVRCRTRNHSKGAVLEWEVCRILPSLHSVFLMAGNKVLKLWLTMEVEFSFNSKEWGGTRDNQLTWTTIVMEVMEMHLVVNSPCSIQSLQVIWTESSNKCSRWTRNCLESVVVPFNRLQVKLLLHEGELQVSKWKEYKKWAVKSKVDKREFLFKNKFKTSFKVAKYPGAKATIK